MEDNAEASPNPISQGCGSRSQISIQISPTTGGDFAVLVEPSITVENLKKLVSKKLKLSRDRICLLFRNKQLQEGHIAQYGISHGSKITLVPNVETGLIAQRPEASIIQALETLNDAQVHEFLCGKAPLNLSMRLGDHMMLIQLQLSTVSGVKPAAPSGNSTGVTRSPSLIQASRNLQHTLRRLSADVFSGRDEGRRGSIYSGTFSGALNPALQDPKGRPRRDVATIVHILNDLLCSAPDLRRVNIKNTDGTAQSAEQEEQPSGSSCSEDQNLRTRGKLEHLRLVMGERRARRRQRKQKPYSLPQSDPDTVTA
ncbi:midnolin-A [Onthophagus taurus]|uniref:midnolin-A n=1 Tax=Onthophagus taurus TaxID=166361 RepID=UPI000C205515|nr:midnolin homolog [Onthophagus taurus]